MADAIRESALGAGIKQCSEEQLSSPCMAGILDHAETMDGRDSDDSGHAGKSKNSVVQPTWLLYPVRWEQQTNILTMGCCHCIMKLDRRLWNKGWALSQ